MKKVFTIISFFVFTVACHAQKKEAKISAVVNDGGKTKTVEPALNTNNNSALTFTETGFDFGKIPQGKPVTHTFQFKNTGNIPFALQNVVASCGCTTPEWNKDTIAIGATGVIKVGYNAASEGPFDKLVTITYDSSHNTQITIKGEVWKTPATSAPLNTALNSFKNEQ